MTSRVYRGEVIRHTNGQGLVLLLLLQILMEKSRRDTLTMLGVLLPTSPVLTRVFPSRLLTHLDTDPTTTM